MITLSTATLEERNQAKEIANYIIDHLKPHFTLCKIIDDYYYCFNGDKDENFDIILDSLNYRLLPVLRENEIKDINTYFEDKVRNIINESVNNR